MNPVGYGVMMGGRPMGVWPVPLSIAEKSALRYKESQEGHPEPKTVEVVPVFAGSAVKTL